MNYENLLTQINAISKKYDEIARITGEDYNIFQVLGLEGKELSHSRILASFLNPRGTHGKGEAFLNLFLRIPGINLGENDGLAEAKIRRERSVTDGRIDIFIEHKNFVIVIENKVYARDRAKQLLRYARYLTEEQNGKETRLIYLTPRGTPASEESKGNQKIDDIQLSYKEHIIDWLEECRKIAVDTPLLRETIAQYIILLRKLTGQSRSRKMADEILDTMEKNVEASFDIAKNLKDLKLRIIDKEFIPGLEQIASDYKLNLILYIEDKKKGKNGLHAALTEPWQGFHFDNPAWKYVSLQFKFRDKNFQNCLYGFGRKGKDEEIPEKMKSYLKKISDTPTNWLFAKDCGSWGKEQFGNVEQCIGDIRSKVEKLLAIAEEYKKENGLNEDVF
jgi:hypothetical protein